MAYVPVGGALRRTAPHRPQKQFPAAGVRLQDDERVEQKPAARSSERGAWKTSSSANARCGPLKIQYLSRDLRFEMAPGNSDLFPELHAAPEVRRAGPSRAHRRGVGIAGVAFYSSARGRHQCLAESPRRRAQTSIGALDGADIHRRSRSLVQPLSHLHGAPIPLNVARSNRQLLPEARFLRPNKAGVSVTLSHLCCSHPNLARQQIGAHVPACKTGRRPSMRRAPCRLGGYIPAEINRPLAQRLPPHAPDQAIALPRTSSWRIRWRGLGWGDPPAK